ncbi:peptidoglycan-binding domain-containing protein [Clostridium manihotivorum]|nr:peptidoglycan-binding domain-containing protein [Clostridium manihotivorum]
MLNAKKIIATGTLVVSLLASATPTFAATRNSDLKEAPTAIMTPQFVDWSTSASTIIARGGVIQKGDQGLSVRQVQIALNNYGHYGLSTDGIFGTATENAVRQFQFADPNIVQVDGIVGSESWNVLQNYL